MTRAARTPSPCHMQALVDRFNAECPPGTPVRIWPGIRPGRSEVVQVREPGATILSGHTPVAWTTYRSCVALTHVEKEPVALEAAE